MTVRGFQSDGSDEPTESNELDQFRGPEERSVLLDRVRNHALPESVIPLIDAYEEVVGDRDQFLWKWAHHLFPKFTLTSVAPEHVERTRDAKLLGLMFVSVLDDIAEKHGEMATFEEAAKFPFPHRVADPDREGVDREVLTFASDVWEQFSPAVKQGPRAGEFEEIVRFDLEQVVNAMRYSYLANQNIDFVTRSELQTYEAHNMMLFGFAGIDLVHSPSFDRSELSTLRRVIDRAQRMVRIGNWITTWERELSEGDFASGIVVYALEHDIIPEEDVRAIRAGDGAREVERVAETIRSHDVEDVFLAQWREELVAAREFETEVDSVDVNAYLDGIETVMKYHLASRGLK